MVVFAATNAHAAAPCLGAPGPPECLHERRLLRHAEDVSRCGCRGRSDKRLSRGAGREANYFQVYRPRHRGPANRRRSSPLHHHSARGHWCPGDVWCVPRLTVTGCFTQHSRLSRISSRCDAASTDECLSVCR